VRCFKDLWDRTREIGLTWSERVTYVQFAHDLVQPHLVSAVANFVRLEQQPPTAMYMRGIFRRLVRRHGLRKGSEKRDAFRLASIMPRAGQYCGPKILNQKLKPRTT